MRPITDVLRDIRRGAVVDHASEELAEVVRACVATGKKGTITLKLDIVPDKAEPEKIDIIATVAAKAPKVDLPKGLFFATDDGDLVRDNPRQGDIFEAAPMGVPSGMARA